MHMIIRRALILSCSILVVSCGMFSSEEESVINEGVSNRPTLAELDLQPLKVEPSIAPRLSLKETRDEYAALLPLLKDEKQKQQVAFRLADIEMQLAELAQEEGIPLETQQAQNQADNRDAEAGIDAGIGTLQPASYFNQAISRYREVLDQQASIVAEAQRLAKEFADAETTNEEVQARLVAAFARP